MDPLTSLVVTIVGAALGFYILFRVVRAAVLDALRTHHAEVNQATPGTVSHLDADGL